MDEFPLLTGFLLGVVFTALVAAVVGTIFLRQQRALADALARAEIDSDHADTLRAEAERRAAAEMRNTRLPELEEERRLSQAENSHLQARAADAEARLEAERRSHAAQLRTLEDARAQLTDSFKAISADALRHNNQSFLELAGASLARYQEAARGDLDLRQQAIEALVQPMRESLDKVDIKINDLERARIGAYEALNAQVRSLAESQHLLRGETANLVNALRQPNARGRWGEIQLRRVVELAGMLDHCDFTEQTTLATEDGGSLRPDLLVRLPAGKTVVIDSKAPLDAYFESVRATELPARAAHLRRHAEHIRRHVESLSRKAYWEQFENAPEFVVLFLPGENFFSAALEHDPGLIEHGVERKIIIATPTTLISLLRAVFYGWRQEALSRDAVEISIRGRELYKRLTTLGEHFSKLGASLDNATKAYNQAVGSLENRVLVTARRFRDLDALAAEPDVPLVEPLEQMARRLEAEELDTLAPDINTDTGSSGAERAR